MNYNEAHKILFVAIANTIDLLVENITEHTDDTEIIMPKSICEAINILRAASLKV